MYWCSCVCVKSVFRGWPLPLTQLSHLPTPALHVFLSHLPWLQEYSCSSSDRVEYRIDSHQWQCADESCGCGTVAMFFASRARQGQILYARAESQKTPKHLAGLRRHLRPEYWTLISHHLGRERRRCHPCCPRVVERFRIGTGGVEHDWHAGIGTDHRCLRPHLRQRV